MLCNSHKQVQFLNYCYSSTIQMVWVIFIHVIIEVIDIYLTLKACLSKQVHFSPFFILKWYQFWWNGCITKACQLCSTANVLSVKMLSSIKTIYLSAQFQFLTFFPTKEARVSIRPNILLSVCSTLLSL